MSPASPPASDPAGRPAGLFRVAAIALVATLGFDLFLHAGVLAQPYQEESPFLLPLRDAAIRIPVGYASFAIMIGLVLWLMRRLEISGWREGATFGLGFGFLVWASLALGLASISTAPPALLVGWTLGQPLEIALIGGVIGAGIERLEAGRSLRALAWRAVAFAVAAALLGIVLQNVQGVSTSTLGLLAQHRPEIEA